MTVEELYQTIGGDYEEAKSRLSMDTLIGRFVTKFVEDGSCAALFDAWDAGDDKAAFEAAHRAKGVCANLALNRLTEPASEICEALRPGNEALRARTDVDALVGELKVAHADTIAAIKAFSDAQ